MCFRIERGNVDGEETLPSPGASELLLRFTLRNGCCFSFPHDFPPGNTHLFILHVQQSRTNKQLNHPARLPCSKPQHAACCPAARTSRSTPGMPGHRCCSVVQLWLLWQSPKKKPKRLFFWYFLSPSTGRNYEAIVCSPETHLRAAAKMLIFTQVIPG